MKFEILDVFAPQAYTGNQLAVVFGAADLATAAMQRIAQELNFSETTFVMATGPGRARVRIFTPAEELPFAGHPTLGTAWALTRGQQAITLQLGVGEVPVSFEQGIAWMVPPPAKRLAPLARAEAARLSGLNAARLAVAAEPDTWRCGPTFHCIEVADLAALRQVRPPPGAITGTGDAVFTFCQGGYRAAEDWAARMFFHDGSGQREDAATGSAHSVLAAILQAQGRCGEFRVDQGFEIARPSRILLRVGPTLAVGGAVQLIATGTLATLP